MSRKPDRKSEVTKVKNTKTQKRTGKIESEVLKFVKTNRDLNLDDLEDTVDNIE